ncbi:MAG TPA: SDR family NAD(P)-dependent oxidoreductase, partial [Vicinamibacteria bacterium]
MNEELEDTVALVTGAGGGIGRAAATALAARGADVAVHFHRNEAGAAETARQVEAIGRKAAVYGADLTKRAEAVGLVSAVLARFSRIDVLVNNSGDLVERKGVLEMTEELWRHVIDLNLSSVLFTTQAAAGAMIERKRGVIVNVTSVAAHNGGGPGSLAYAASKGGLISLTKAIAKELAPKGVRVNCVSPGLIGQTSFHERLTSPEVFAAVEKTVPLGRAGTPEEVG